MKKREGVALLFAAMLAGCATLPEKDPHPITVNLKKAEDTATVVPKKRGTRIHIVSKSGIGEATLVRSGKEWPGSMTICLNLNNVESFKMENGYIRFETTLHGTRHVPYQRLGNSRNPVSPPGEMLEAEFFRKGKWMELKVPVQMTAEAPESITFKWINEYR